MAATPPTPAPPTHIHLHTSIPSHLSAELSLLHTFIRRSAAQHRTQLFLQRMEGVLRMGKLVLAYVKQNGTRDSAEGTKGAEKWRWRGECLVRKMVNALYNAQHIASQIIDLRHFVPLQATVVAIYARLFTITLNLAAGLGMDVGQLSLSAGGAQTRKNASAKQPAVAVAVAGGSGARDDVGKMDLGVELGERIERSSLPAAPASAPGLPQHKVVKPTSAKASRSATPVLPKSSQAPPSAAAAAAVPSPQAMRSPEGLSEGDATARLLLKKRKAKKAASKEDAGKKYEGGEAADVLPKKKAKELATQQNGAVPMRTEAVDNGEIAQAAPEKKTKKRLADAEGSGSRLEVAKVKKKKKKKDVMDDIFGF